MAEIDPAITFEQQFDQQIEVEMSTAVLQSPIDRSNIQVEILMTSACLTVNFRKQTLSRRYTYML
jgi:hypothetical protein